MAKSLGKMWAKALATEIRHELRPPNARTVTKASETGRSRATRECLNPDKEIQRIDQAQSPGQVDKLIARLHQYQPVPVDLVTYALRRKAYLQASFWQRLTGWY